MRNLGQIHIRLVLEGDLAEQFESLKNKKALRNNTELIRQLIREEYNRKKINDNFLTQEVPLVE